MTQAKTKIMKPCVKILVIFSCIFLAACNSEKKVDGSSVEAYKSSLDEMRENLTDEEKADFTKALLRIALEEAGKLAKERKGFDYVANPQDKEALEKAVRERLSGMTVDEVVAN